MIEKTLAFTGGVLGGGLVLSLGWNFVLRRKISQQASRVRAQRRREAAWRNQYQELFENANDPVFRMDCRGNILSLNPAAERITGYTREEARQLNLEQITASPDDRWVKMLSRNGGSEEEDGAFEWTVITKEGGRVTLKTTVRPLSEEDRGQLSGFQAMAQKVHTNGRFEKEWEKVHSQLAEASRRAGMAEVATGVLHNVGNVLNSINVSAAFITERINKSRCANLEKVVALVNEHVGVPDFLSEHPQGKQLPDYLSRLNHNLRQEREAVIQELESLSGNIQHVKEIVAVQQAYAKIVGASQKVRAKELVEDALRIDATSLARHDVEINRNYLEDPEFHVAKPKVLQILVNLIRNAKHACMESPSSPKWIKISVQPSPELFLRIQVEDNGVGIPPENLNRIFSHGFTTRSNGHGFGLHSGAEAAKEMGGSLRAFSQGTGRGATFVLDLPERPPKKG